MESVEKLVNKWGYKKGSCRVWIKVLKIEEGFIPNRKDDDAYDFTSYFCTTGTDGDIFLENGVENIELHVREPTCVNGVTNVDNLGDEVIEDLDDTKDDRAIALLDAFEGIDVTLPIREEGVVAGLLG